MLKDFSELIQCVHGVAQKTVAVAVPDSKDILTALQRAQQEGIARAILVGDRKKIEGLKKELRLDFTPAGWVDVADEAGAAHAAVKEVVAGRAQVLMKGNLHTSAIVSALLTKEYGLRSGRPISHVFIMEAKPCGRLLFVTDGAVNIAPDLERKKYILQNAIDFAHCLGYDRPKAAVLAAIEDVNVKMPVTVEAAALAQMAVEGQITGADVAGPLALDDALSPWVCAEKNVTGPVAGRADILLAPNIEAGNILSKSQMFIAGGMLAGVALGAKVPLILTSRADTADNRFYSIAIACLAAEKYPCLT